ncbi:hypothetical protein [Cupriavidus taiwanensis]|uniref:Uncharacterized protein n=1 Tax=Cupriavidus taiwanensis TaxID=164546 RepID=A0A7Z7NQ61_9BURK|nr:hypothetical protein [Cupriavidus taiwanensis]SOZ17392.1 exported hypothetical protein [Cupriavidus taiwanensis]SOZ96336.1 exported hypothetical protein [Cupriavidus taiwanensis]SPC25711.1 exported hypothetical protein [Cupriavidus taiwanensis]
MKSKISVASLAVTIAMLLSANAFAEQVNADASQTDLIYEIKLLENGQLVHSTTLSAIPGKPSWSKSGRWISYLAACDSTAPETWSCSAEKVWDGISIEVRPAVEGNGALTTELEITDSQLIGMDTITHGGYQVEAPRMSSAVAKMSISMREGSTVHLPYGARSTASQREITIIARKS